MKPLILLVNTVLLSGPFTVPIFAQVSHASADPVGASITNWVMAAANFGGILCMAWMFLQYVQKRDVQWNEDRKQDIQERQEVHQACETRLEEITNNFIAENREYRRENRELLQASFELSKSLVNAAQALATRVELLERIGKGPSGGG